MIQSNESFTNETISYKSLLLEVCAFYAQLHGWIAFVICSFGIILNFFNIFILRQTKVASFTTNSILILIAFFDSIMMLFYIPFCIHYYIINPTTNSIGPDPNRDTLFWTAYSLINIFSSITFHCISIWLTVYLAFYRYITLKKSLNNMSRKNKASRLYLYLMNFFQTKSKLFIWVVLVFCVFICIPIYLFPTIKHELYLNGTLSDQNETITMWIYFIDQSELNRATSNLVFKLGFYFQAIGAKLLPCILLIILMKLIIDLMFIIKRNKDKICSKSAESRIAITKRRLIKEKNETNEIQLSNQTNLNIDLDERRNLSSFKRNSKIYEFRQSFKTRDNKHVRSSIMLVVVCALIFTAEFPQAILLVISIFDFDFYVEVYKPLGDLLDILVLTNYSISFSIYCSMSKEFRKAFRMYFHQKFNS